MRITFSFQIFALLVLLPVTASALEWWFGGNYTDETGNKDFAKPIWVNSLNIVQNITVFKWKWPVEACPDNPNYGPSRTVVPMPQHWDVCYKGCKDTQVLVPATYDGSGNLIEAEYYLYSRISCQHRAPWYNVVLGGKHFAPGYGPEFDKNAQCGDATSPNMGLIVTMAASKGYMWDPVPPVCVRGWYSSANPGTKFLLSQTGYVEDLSGMLNSLKSEAKDDTLRYMDRDKEVYTGAWTNRDVEATGYCADGESGCEKTSPMKSWPLNHRQIAFSVDPFYDNVRNESTLSWRICNSTVKTMDPKNIKRNCTFKISTDFLDKRLKETGYTNAEDIAAIDKIKQTIFSLKWETFKQAILKLRDIAKRMGKDMHFLYEILGCTYTVEYETEKVRGPYIDKILPTVRVTGAGQKVRENIGTEQTLLDDEKNMIQTGKYYAGEHSFTIALLDADTSLWNAKKTNTLGWPSVTQTGNIDGANWEKIAKNWSGVSGIDMYLIELDRIADATGQLLPLTLSWLPRSENIFFTGWESELKISDERPRTGPAARYITINRALNIAWVYRWAIYTRDVAGNITVQYAYFEVFATPDNLIPTIIVDYTNTIIVDKNNRSGSGSDGLTNPGGSLDETGPGNNIADGIKRTLAMSFQDQYKNPLIPDTRIGRTIDMSITVDHTLFMNQFLRNGGSSVDIGMEKNDSGETEWKNVPVWWNSKVEFINVKPNLSNSYNFYVRTYTPTAGWYTEDDGQVSDILAHLKIQNITGKAIDTAPPAWVLPNPMIYEDGNMLKLEVFFRPLYVSHMKWDITLWGFIEWAVQQSNVATTKNGVRKDSDMSNHRLQLTFSGSNSNVFSFYAHTNDTTASGVAFSGTLREIVNPIAPFPSSPRNLYTRLIQKQNTIIETISKIFLSTHFSYTLDGHAITYNSAVVGKDSFHGNELSLGFQNVLKTVWSTSSNSANTTTTESGAILLIGNASIANVNNEVRRSVANNTRNLPIGKDIVKNLHTVEWDFKTSTDKDYQVINGSRTLIIKWWNLFIDKNMSYANSNSVLGIIVLSDENGKWGSVYIDPSITNIVGTYFVQKAVMSGKKDGPNIQTYDSTISIDILRNQLYLFGNIISQNTIGGARKEPYVCPSYVQEPCNESTAQKYDLNYIRRYFLINAGTIGGQSGVLIPYKWDANPPTRIIGWGTCDGNGKCSGFDSSLVQKYDSTTAVSWLLYSRYPFIVEYNPMIVNNPPPVFKEIRLTEQ